MKHFWRSHGSVDCKQFRAAAATLPEQHKMQKKLRWFDGKKKLSNINAILHLSWITIIFSLKISNISWFQIGAYLNSSWIFEDIYLVYTKHDCVASCRFIVCGFFARLHLNKTDECEQRLWQTRERRRKNTLTEQKETNKMWSARAALTERVKQKRWEIALIMLWLWKIAGNWDNTNIEEYFSMRRKKNRIHPRQ